MDKNDSLDNPILLKERICEIKNRLQNTTPGVWDVAKLEDEDDDPCVVVQDTKQYVAQTAYEGLSYTRRETSHADAKFIANAKEDIEFLIAVLEISILK